MIHFMQFVKHLGSVRFPYWLFSHFPAQDFLCRIFQSCIFTSCILVPHFPALQFCAVFSIPAFSSPAFFLVPHFHVSYFQSPLSNRSRVSNTSSVSSWSQVPGWYSIYLPRRDGRLSWPRWLFTYRDGLPTRRWSPIQVLTRPSVN